MQTNNMENIKFIPKEFRDVELNLYNHKKYPCTPHYTEDLFASSIILINIPKKIYVYQYNKEIKEIKQVIPMCAVFAISQKRALKYEHLSTPKIHIRKVDQDITYSGEIVDPNLKYEYLVYPPGYEEAQKKKIEMIKEAQKYSDEELNDGLIAGDAMNINLLDYVDMPFIAGRYEIFISCYNLESNKTYVEIIMKKVK
jgi:hypothetical protein